MSRLALVLRFTRHLTAASALIVLTWVGVAKADPPQPSEGSSREAPEATAKQRKEIGSTRSTFVLTPEQMEEAREIARMIVSQAPEQAIRNTVLASFLMYSSQTEGAGHLSDQAGLEAIRRDVVKEMRESAQEKDKAVIEAQRKHVERMLEVIEEMMKLQSDQSDTKLSK